MKAELVSIPDEGFYEKTNIGFLEEMGDLSIGDVGAIIRESKSEGGLPIVLIKFHDMKPFWLHLGDLRTVGTFELENVLKL